VETLRHLVWIDPRRKQAAPARINIRLIVIPQGFFLRDDGVIQPSAPMMEPMMEPSENQV